MAELGHFALLLSLFLSGYAVLADLLGAWRKDLGSMGSGRADDDEAASSLRDLLVVRDDALVDRAVGVGRADVGGDVTNAIRRLEAADSHR